MAKALGLAALPHEHAARGASPSGQNRHARHQASGWQGARRQPGEDSRRGRTARKQAYPCAKRMR
eukprot:1281410-Prymnesium_polylepis.1